LVRSKSPVKKETDFLDLLCTPENEFDVLEADDEGGFKL
jgi:hypothetical protein